MDTFRKKMRLEKKIVLIWFAAFLLLRVAMEIPHRDFGWIGFMNTFIQLLLALICYQIFRLSKGSQKLAWLNFTLLFGAAPLWLLSSYIGTSILPGDVNAQFYTHLYLNQILLPLLIAMTIIYIAADYYFRTIGRGRKYFISVVVAVLVVAPFLGRSAITPVSIMQEEEYQNFKYIRWVSARLSEEGIDPSAEAITARISETGWAGRSAGEISEKVNTLSPYLPDLNYTTLFWRPVEISIVGVHAVIAAMIVLLLVSIYRSNRPVPAYVDKVLLGLGMCEVLEVFHHYGFAYSRTLAGYSLISHAAQYFTIVILLGVAGIFALKLRFLAKGAGRYYEMAIASDPRQTTRLVDDIDRLILTSFFPDGRRGTLAHQKQPEQSHG